MEAIDALLTRRSVRSYRPEPVSEADTETLLRAAMAAPSAGNQQPWHFVVIRDRALLDAIRRFHPYAQMLREAPLAILVCGDLTREMHPGYWVLDCSAATQNILLATHARGLGAVWLGIYPRPDRMAGVRELIGLPDSIQPLALVAVGHPAETPPPADRYDPARLHHDRW